MLCSLNSYFYNDSLLYKELKLPGQDKYVLLEKHSSNKHTVYLNNKNKKELIVSFKGSTDLSDIL